MFLDSFPVFFSSPRSFLPFSSPLERQSSGLTGHTHTHTQWKGDVFLFCHVHPGRFQLFSPLLCDCASYAAIWLFRSLILGALLVAPVSRDFGFFGFSVASFLGFWVRSRLGFSSFVFSVLVSFFLWFCVSALHHTLVSRHLFSGGPARVFSPSPSPTVGQGKSLRARQVGPCLNRLAVRL